MPKNRLYIEHPQLINFPGTELSANLSAGSTTGSVLNNVDFASNNLILMGSYGGEETEVVSCSGTTTDTQVNFSAVNFAHAKGTVLTRIEYDQYVLERCGTETGTYAAIRTAGLSVDEPKSMYVDNTTWSSAWYKYRYYDSALTTYSDYSDVFQIEYKENSLHEIRQLVRDLSDVDADEDKIDRLINHYQRKILNQYNYGFMETSTAMSSVADQVEYDIPSDCKVPKAVRVIYGSAYYDPNFVAFDDFTLAQLNTSAATIPTIWTRVGNEIWFHNPFSDLGTNNIVVFYTKYPARLDSDNDVSSIPMIDPLACKVASVLCMSSNPEKSSELKGDYIGGLNELKAAYGVDQIGTFPSVGYGKIDIEKIIEIDTA